MTVPSTSAATLGCKPISTQRIRIGGKTQAEVVRWDDVDKVWRSVTRHYTKCLRYSGPDTACQ